MIPDFNFHDPDNLQNLLAVVLKLVFKAALKRVFKVVLKETFKVVMLRFKILEVFSPGKRFLSKKKT